MLRPISTIGFRISLERSAKNCIRNKVVYPASILNQVDKIKLYHKENRELFGPLLETNKQRKRSHKSAKNSQVTRQKNAAANENNIKFTDSTLTNSSSKLIQPKNLISPLSMLKKKMWQSTRTCISYVGIVFNNVQVRGLSTSAVNNIPWSSPAKPGYVSEDKILQIRPHKNDFAEQYPSVTLILNKTMSEESRKALEKWKQERIAELGEAEFRKFYEAQMALGTKFHSTLKNYFTQSKAQLRIEKDVEGMWVSVADVLKNISSPKAIESNVIHPVLKYRGIFDAIADYEDKPTLIEWKKSDRPRKSLANTYDNPIQLAAYFGAVSNDLNYKHLNVRDALLVIAYTDGSKADVYHLPTDKLREHWAHWLMRLEDYSNKFGSNAEKLLKGGKRYFEEDIEHLQ